MSPRPEVVLRQPELLYLQWTILLVERVGVVERCPALRVSCWKLSYKVAFFDQVRRYGPTVALFVIKNGLEAIYCNNPGPERILVILQDLSLVNKDVIFFVVIISLLALCSLLSLFLASLSSAEQAGPVVSNALEHAGKRVYQL